MITINQSRLVPDYQWVERRWRDAREHMVQDFDADHDLNHSVAWSPFVQVRRGITLGSNDIGLHHTAPISQTVGRITAHVGSP
jgi:hypothetical protein